MCSVRRLVLFFLPLFFSKISLCQLVVDTSRTPAQLVQNVLLGGNLIATNIKYTGATHSIGYFDGTNSNIGLKNGILMTNGSVGIAVGPNNTGNRGIWNHLPGDTALTRICGDSTFDASILEFDFIPYADTVSFDFVFGSEEYPEFTCCKVNDVFAFFISGPGISGYKNIAIVPGTIIPISINTLNGNCTSQSNCGGGCCNNNSQYYIDNTGGQTIEYTGFTTVMKALSPVQCGQQYHIRIGIADGGDGYYDSGVFLGGGSFVGGTEALHIAYQPVDSICPHDPVSISFPDNNPSHQFQWTFDSANIQSGSGSGPYLVNWITAGQKKVKVSLSGPCAYDVDSTYVTVNACDVVVPNVFTPGTGDKNSIFFIYNLSKFPNSNLEIYNRWGQIIYSSTYYQNDWDGGNQPDGTYFYVLTLDNGEAKRGFVTLLRK
jgi:gliding motility-associated-like protein